MGRFFAVFERDLRRFLRNPIVVLMSILMPIIYLVILGNSFQGELKRLPVAIVDMDNGPYARRVMELLRSIEAGPATLRLHLAPDQGIAMKGLREGAFKAVLIIPAGFSRDAVKKAGPELGLFLDNTETVSSLSIRAAISRALSDGRDVLVREGRAAPALREIEIYKKIDYDQTLIPGVVIMAIFLGAMTTGAFNLVMDRFLGIEESYLLTPLTKRDIVMGLVLSGLLITTIIAAIVLFLSSLISGIHLWSMMTLEGIVLTACIVILSTLGLQGLMFVLMGRVGHPRIVGVLGGFLNVILFFPSGAIYPTESFPGWLKAFSAINPETYSVHALRAVLFKNGTFHAVAEDIGYLAVFAFVLLGAGILSFKRGL